MNGDADRAGARASGRRRIGMCMGGFQRCHHHSHQDATQREEALQLAGLELADANHATLHTEKHLTIPSPMDTGKVTYLTCHRYFGHSHSTRATFERLADRPTSSQPKTNLIEPPFQLRPLITLLVPVVRGGAPEHWLALVGIIRIAPVLEHGETRLDVIEL